MALRLPRLVVLGIACLLGLATLAFAAEQKLTKTPPVVKPVIPPAQPLVVPDVRRQAFVFAKGMLEDAGFAWKISGGVQGYAANVVASQTPAPGTRVVDNPAGAPTVALVLARNGHYAQHGAPEDASPYAGTQVELADTAGAQTSAPGTTHAATIAPGALKLRQTKPVAAKPAAKPAPAKPAAPRYPQVRPPAFPVPGARKEPLNEMPLPDRARLLGTWLAGHPKPTNANVRHWLYQHEWIVDGARFGWWRGAEALRILIEDDRQVEARWGIGAKSEAAARQALVEVEAKSR